MGTVGGFDDPQVAMQYKLSRVADILVDLLLNGGDHRMILGRGGRHDQCEGISGYGD